jgi:hypothetical protein
MLINGMGIGNGKLKQKLMRVVRARQLLLCIDKGMADICI